MLTTLCNGGDSDHRNSMYDVQKHCERYVSKLLLDVPDSNLILIVDDAMAINLRSCMQLSNLCSARIFLVESIKKARKPYPHFSAVYLLSSIDENADFILKDLLGPKSRYKAAFIYHADPQIDTSARCFRLILHHPLVKVLKHFFLSFQCIAPHTLHFNMHLDMARFLRKNSVNDCSILIESLSATLNALEFRPHLFYQSSSNARHIALQLQERFLLRGPPDDHLTHTTCDMLIVDRFIDVMSPLLYDFSYEAIIYDLKRYLTSEGEAIAQNLNHTQLDPLWLQMRHLRIDCLQSILLDASKKARQRTPSKEAPGCQSTTTLSQLALSASQNKKMVQSIERHMKVISDIVQLQEQIGFSHIIEIQQILVKELLTGHSTLSERDIDEILSNVSSLVISKETKQRIFYLFALTNSSFKTGKLEKIQEAFQIPNENLLIAEKLRILHKNGESYREACRAYQMQVGRRYSTILHAAVSGFIKNSVNPELFMPVDKHFQKDSTKLISPLVVFIIGGFSVSEMHDLRQLAEDTCRPILLMGTSCLCPKEYMYQLGLMSTS